MTKLVMTQESDTDTLEYKKRVIRAKTAIDNLPYGSQAQLGYDIRVTSTIVSAIFAGRYVAPDILTYIEDWLHNPDRARIEGFARSRDLLAKIKESLEK